MEAVEYKTQNTKYDMQNERDAPEGPAALMIMGTQVRPFESYSQAVDHVAGIVASGRKSLCVAINPEKVQRAKRDPSLAKILREAAMGICDGVGVALAARLLYGRKVPRCTGADLFFELISAAAEREWKVFLLGASRPSNEGAAAALSARYSDLQIVGQQDGYFEDDQAVIREINASGADLLFVAMGSPRQEFWITKHRQAIAAPFCMGVGGTLDVAAGTVKRSPIIFRKTGTEFLFRLITQPSRWRRQLALPIFLLAVLRERFFSRSKGF